ncbi:MAG: Nif3-like dinuclear metal center hexameric protein [Pirellulaceae bacterium]
MTTLKEIVHWMDAVAPLQLSEAWDNTGLLLGDQTVSVSKVQTCLTLTPESVQEAVESSVELVVAHHPLPFKPLSKITTETYYGRLVWELASNRIAVYAPHTAWDSAEDGINAQLARLLSLNSVAPLIPSPDPESVQVGTGRIGDLDNASTARELAERLGPLLPGFRPRAVLPDLEMKRVAIACGSGASLLGTAIDCGCELFLTGEATFHQCLEAKAAGVSMLLAGHYASERFSIERLAQRLATQFADVSCWASRLECDPIISLA